MLPVLNHKSTAHWHLGRCCICFLPCPALPLYPGDTAAQVMSSDLPRCCPGLDQLLSRGRVMNAVQISPILTSCSVYYCKRFFFST